MLPFAPDAAYGTPEDLKRLVAAAHARGLMVLLDVVYNHFGPEGNYLVAVRAGSSSTRRTRRRGARRSTSTRRAARTVRDFFVHNALYWIEEYHFDGLRLDAVHAIADDSSPHIVAEIAAAVADGPGRERHVHLVLENDRNEARWLERGDARPSRHGAVERRLPPRHARAAHRRARRLLRRLRERPAWRLLARTLAEGFAYQGEASAHRKGEPRGEPSAHLPLTTPS